MAIDLGDAVVKVKADTTAMMSSMAGMKKQVGMVMAAVGTGIVVGLGKAAKAAMGFEQAITNAASVTGKTGEEFEIARDKMADLAKTLGATTVFSAQEAANAMYDLASKGFDVAAMSVEDLEPLLNLAAATQNDLKATTEVTTATLKGFGLANNEMARVADVFTYAIGNSAAKMELLSTSMPVVGTTAKIMNVSLEETTASLSALYDKGVLAGTAATGLRNIMMDLNAKKKPIVDGFKKYKISLEGIDIAADGLVGTFKKLRERGLEATQAAEIFGKRSGSVAANVLLSVDAIGEFADKLENAGGIAKTVAEIQLATTQGAFTLLGSQIKAVVLEIGGALLPALKWVATALAGVFGAMAEWMKQHPVLTRGIVALTAAIGTGLIVGGLLMAVTGIKIAVIALAGVLKGALVVAIHAAGAALVWLAAHPAVAALIAVTIATAKIVKEVNKVKEARKELKESSERLAKAETEIEERMGAVRRTSLYQQTGYVRRNIELIRAEIQAQYGKAVGFKFVATQLMILDRTEMNLAQKKAAILKTIRDGEVEDVRAATHTKIELKATEVAATVQQLADERRALEDELQKRLAGFREELAGLEHLEGSEEEINLQRRLINKTYGEAVIKLRKLVGEKNTEITEANRNLAISDTQTAREIERAEARKKKAVEDWKVAVEGALLRVDQMIVNHTMKQEEMTNIEIANLRRLREEYERMVRPSWFVDVMEKITEASGNAFGSISANIEGLIGMIGHLRTTIRTMRQDASLLPSWMPEWLRTAPVAPVWLRAPGWESTESPEIQLQQQLLGANLYQLSQAIENMNQPAAGGVTVNVESLTVENEDQATTIGQSLYDEIQTEFSSGGTPLGFV